MRNRVVLWSTIGAGLLFFVALLLGIGAQSGALRSRHQSAKDTKPISYLPGSSGEVLAESDTATGSGAFVVNVPFVLNGDISGNGRTIDLGREGRILASNIISALLQGAGLTIVPGENQSYTLINSDKGSDQKTFGTISVAGNTIAADTNEDTLEFEAGEGLELSVENGKIIIKSKSGSGTGNVTQNITQEITQVFAGGGFERDSTTETISLQNTLDKVALGTDVAQGKLTVVSSDTTQTGVVVQAMAGQTASLLTLKDATGSALIDFDANGNAVFKGNITQTGNTKIIGGGLTFNAQDPIVFDGVGDEPDNILANGGLESDLSSWTASTPTLVNQIPNPDFDSTDRLTGWSSEVDGPDYSEQFTNTGFESDIGDWNLSGGGLYAVTEYGPTSNGPGELVAGPDGNIWYIVSTANKVGKITPSGVITEYTTPSSGPYSITVGADNNLWYTTYNGALGTKVGKITTSGSITEYTTASGPFGITAGPDGNLWYTLRGLLKIGNITTAGVASTCSPTTSGGLFHITNGPDGNLWYAAYDSYRIGKITTSCAITEYTLTVQANSVATGPDGNIWYSSQGWGRIIKVTPSGTASYYNVSNPTMDITAGPDGNMWFTTNTNKIGKITTSGVVTTYNTILSGLSGIAVGSDGNIWYAVSNSNKIGKLQIAGPTRMTSPTYSFTSGSIKLPASGSALTMTQSFNLSASNSYLLTGYAYIDGTTPVTSSDAELYFNGFTYPTSYEDVGGGWYKLTTIVPGAGSSTTYGIQIKSGQTVYVDNMSLRQVSGSAFSFTPFNTALGASQISVPTSATADFTTTRPLIPGDYTFSVYAYTSGAAVTTADAELVFDGSIVPTTINAGAKSGWYELTGSFSVTTEGSYKVGVKGKSGKTVYVDDAYLTIASVGATTTHVTKENPITYSGTEGAAQLSAIGTSDITFTQSVTVPTDGEYTFIARVYDLTPGNTGGVVDSSKAVLTINNSPASTTYSAANGGFWNAQTDSTLTAGTYTVGVTVKSGNKVVLDAIALQAGSGSDRTFRVVNSGTGLAFLDVESTIFANSGKTNKNALVITSADNQTANLVEWKDFNSNVLGVIDEAGRIAVGSSTPSHSLEVVQSTDTSQPVAFLNSSTTDTPQAGVLKLMTGVTTTGVDTRFIQFYAGATTTSNGTGVGRIRLNNGGVAYESGGADFAEYFTTDDASRYQPGDVVMLATPQKNPREGTESAVMDREDAIAGRAVKAEQAYAPTLLGVVSNTAAFVGNAKETDATDSARIIVGLTGQMKVNVSTISGTIKAGDLLTSSTIEGMAQKATKPGMTLGIALEDISVSTTEAKVFVRPAWNAANPTTEPWYASGEASLADISLLDKPDPITGETVLDQLSVLGKLAADEIFSTGGIASGQLRLEGFNTRTSETGDVEGVSSIDTLAGALLLQSHAQGTLEIMAGKVTIDQSGDLTIKEGKLRGNDSFSGAATIPAGETSVRVERQWHEKPKSLLANPESDSSLSWRLSDVGPAGFTVTIAEKQEKNVIVYWFAIF